MEIKRVVRLYFSPTHGTEKIVNAVADAVAASEVLDLNRTSFDSRWSGAKLREGDFAIIGLPIYYGRVPRIMVEFFRSIEAKNVPAALVMSYGNRGVDDALLEMKDICTEKGFLPVSAGAFVGQHSFTEKMGRGRPNTEDLKMATEFGAASAELVRKAASVEDLKALSLEVPGAFPYRPATDIPVAPSTDMDKCNGCMLCQQECPVQAINPLDPSDIDGWRCLDCARCIQSCPQGAKALTFPALQEKITIMEAMFTAPKENQLYYAK